MNVEQQEEGDEMSYYQTKWKDNAIEHQDNDH
jgi:hypothetical protein